MSVCRWIRRLVWVTLCTVEEWSYLPDGDRSSSMKLSQHEFHEEERHSAEQQSQEVRYEERTWTTSSSPFTTTIIIVIISISIREAAAASRCLTFNLWLGWKFMKFWICKLSLLYTDTWVKSARMFSSQTTATSRWNVSITRSTDVG